MKTGDSARIYKLENQGLINIGHSPQFSQLQQTTL